MFSENFPAWAQFLVGSLMGFGVYGFGIWVRDMFDLIGEVLNRPPTQPVRKGCGHITCYESDKCTLGPFGG